MVVRTGAAFIAAGRLASDVGGGKLCVMGYDERAVAFTEKLDRLIGNGDAGRHRCGAILNALEVLVEEDAPPADLVTLQLLGQALLAQAALARLDLKRISVLVEGLNAHVKAR